MAACRYRASSKAAAGRARSMVGPIDHAATLLWEADRASAAACPNTAPAPRRTGAHPEGSLPCSERECGITSTYPDMTTNITSAREPSPHTFPFSGTSTRSPAATRSARASSCSAPSPATTRRGASASLTARGLPCARGCSRSRSRAACTSALSRAELPTSKAAAESRAAEARRTGAGNGTPPAARASEMRRAAACATVVRATCLSGPLGPGGCLTGTASLMGSSAASINTRGRII
mmetsp:Transcript_49778/g.159027  ORF Transcript_49778/g.159027 Transcript_49778/m.159027 type:complete len:236 (-) Transcript_49778:1571-2278(-)